MTFCSRQVLTALYNPEKNGTAKHDNRTLMELVCSMIHSQKSPLTFGLKLLKPPSMLLTKSFLILFHVSPTNPGTVNAPLSHTSVLLAIKPSSMLKNIPTLNLIPKIVLASLWARR
jgi:hypothetical protein